MFGARESGQFYQMEHPDDVIAIVLVIVIVIVIVTFIIIVIVIVIVIVDVTIKYCVIVFMIVLFIILFLHDYLFSLFMFFCFSFNLFVCLLNKHIDTISAQAVQMFGPSPGAKKMMEAEKAETISYIIYYI